MRRAAWMLLLGACGPTPLEPLSLAAPIVVTVSSRTTEGVLVTTSGREEALPFLALRIDTSGEPRVGPFAAFLPAVGEPPLTGLVLTSGSTAAVVERASPERLDLKLVWPIELLCALDQLDPWAVARAPALRFETDLHVIAEGGAVRVVFTARGPGDSWRVEGLAPLAARTLHVEAPAAAERAPDLP